MHLRVNVWSLNVFSIKKMKFMDENITFSSRFSKYGCMKVIIIEDEPLAALRISKLITKIESSLEILSILDSVEASVEWLNQHTKPDLILMDIELADGQCFEIFKQVDVKSPIIFTTAYHEFAIKAFEVNSIDYLLKPIQENALEKAIAKFKDLVKNKNESIIISDKIESIIKALDEKKSPKQRFLVKQGEKFIPIKVEEIAYFFSQEKVIFLQTFENKKYILDQTLDEIENQLDLLQFFRLNRQFIVSSKSIVSIYNYFNGKLKVILNPNATEEVVVSREKATVFKNWMDS